MRREEGDIRYIDHATTEQLKIKYAVNDGHDISEIVDVSYVWDGGGLRKAIPDAVTFDYALASHVVEHVPDVIGWLNDIGTVLKPGGLIGLAIPDKRYTFDVLRDVSTVAQLIDNHLRQIKRPVAAKYLITLPMSRTWALMRSTVSGAKRLSNFAAYLAYLRPFLLPRTAKIATSTVTLRCSRRAVS